MDEERYPALPWQGWKIVKRLGRGGYGSVYLAQRNSAGVMEDAAVKVISFPSDDMIGRYVSQGYENPSFGFAINLPDTYTLENRNNVALNDADIVESSNSEGTYDYLKSLISLGSAVVFSAEDGNTYIELNIQNAAVLDKTAKWDEEKNIAENSVMTEEDAKKLMGEDAQVTEFQNNVEEITFLGEKHYAAQYTFKNYDVSYYGVTVFLVNEQDSQYMLAVNIIGVDLNVVDQADQFFSVYTE